jgi:RNA polymerase-binding transcription factor DksA
MQTSDTAQARAELETERARILSDLADLGLGPDGSLEYDDNFADTSQVTAERGEAEALAGELAETLRDVEAALSRLEEGTYGACELCGKPIGEARLEAMPAARRCIDCAAKA